MESDMPIVLADDLAVGQPLPGWHDRYFHSDNMSFEYYDVDEGSSIHEHFQDEAFSRRTDQCEGYHRQSPRARAHSTA